MTKLFYLTIAAVAGFILYWSVSQGGVHDISVTPNENLRFWQIQSIDTMKFSRDLAKERINDSRFDQVIAKQVSDIAQTKATHIAIGTPYDEEFTPFMRKWVIEARKNNLNVWFRGNLSGWEGWFGYPRIDRAAHVVGVENFILNNPDLFEDGDIFSACPECENGGPGDPRLTKDIEGHRTFLIEEYNVLKNSFKKIGKQVASNYYSMNGDIVDAVMDPQTARALDGIVVVDHYVLSPEILAADVERYAIQTGGKIVLGEFGAPIPDIHGKFTEEQQRDWIKNSLNLLSRSKVLIGINYWTNADSSTQLWRSDGTQNEAGKILSEFYDSKMVHGFVRDELDRPIADARVATEYSETTTNRFGYFELPVAGLTKLSVVSDLYHQEEIVVERLDQSVNFKLVLKHEGPIFRAVKLIRNLGQNSE